MTMWHDNKTKLTLLKTKKITCSQNPKLTNWENHSYTYRNKSEIVHCDDLSNAVRSGQVHTVQCNANSKDSYSVPH